MNFRERDGAALGWKVFGGAALTILLLPSAWKAGSIFQRASGVRECVARLAAFSPNMVVLGLLIQDFGRMPAVEAAAATALIREILQEAFKSREPEVRFVPADNKKDAKKDWGVRRDGDLLAIMPNAAGAFGIQVLSGRDVDLIAAPARGAENVVLAAALRGWFKACGELSKLLVAVSRGGSLERDPWECRGLDWERFSSAAALRLDFIALGATITAMSKHVPAEGPARELLQASGALLQGVNELRSTIYKAAKEDEAGRGSPVSRRSLCTASSGALALAVCALIVVGLTCGLPSAVTTAMAVAAATGISLGWVTEHGQESVRAERDVAPVESADRVADVLRAEDFESRDKNEARGKKQTNASDPELTIEVGDLDAQGTITPSSLGESKSPTSGPSLPSGGSPLDGAVIPWADSPSSPGRTGQAREISKLQAAKPVTKASGLSLYEPPSDDGGPPPLNRGGVGRRRASTTPVPSPKHSRRSRTLPRQPLFHELSGVLPTEGLPRIASVPVGMGGVGLEESPSDVQVQARTGAEPIPALHDGRDGRPPVSSSSSQQS
jgi:hypothetical protein